MPRGVPNKKPGPKPKVKEAAPPVEEGTVATLPAEEPEKTAFGGCSVNHHIHALEDGLTVAGLVLYRGQEFNPEPDTEEWNLIHPNGTCLLDMDRRAQVKRFGRQMWDTGAWPFDAYDLEEDGLTDQDKERLARENASRGLN